MKIGVICPSEIARRRFMPALISNELFEFAGLARYSQEERFGKDYDMNSDLQKETVAREIEKQREYLNEYSGNVFDSYRQMIDCKDIDAVYLPLPPALHYEWAYRAIESGKHVLIEKPATVKYEQALMLVAHAKEKNVALHENYMFVFHKQLQNITDIIRSGQIGKPRLYRIDFGFPKRGKDDFRYDKALGGGALIDAGGYCIRYAMEILGESARLVSAVANYEGGLGVDLYGSATLINDKGETVQISFGMDNNYKCNLEVWGSEGTFTTKRVLTAPVGFAPVGYIEKNGTVTEVELDADDAFGKSIEHFYNCITDASVRNDQYEIILKQARMMDEFRSLAGIE